ncbi:hypothetical protein BBFL7_02354 [Flavobacteria bacterium BBFL7]|nr:hypothetical protein BBFL7_02354 [Flavobacteria bacterium BBFL7]
MIDQISIKNKVYKIFLLIVIVVTSIVSCEKYDLTDNSLSEYKSPFKVSELDFTETKLPRDITQFVRNNSFEINRKSNVVIDSAQNFYVNTDKVKYLQAIDSSFHNYTFLVNRLNKQNDIIENLVFSSDSLGGYSANLVKYDFNINNKVSISRKPININSQDYIKSFYLDCVTTVTYESFQDAMCDCEVIKILSTETDCTFVYYSDPDSGGGSGGNTGGSSGGGFGGGAWTGGGGGGTTVGTSPILPGPNDKCEEEKDYLNELTNHPDVKPEMEALEAYVDGNPTNEDGVELQLESDGSYTSVPPVSTGNGFTSFATASANTVVQIHAHGVGDYDYPTDGDLVLFSVFLNQVKEANTNSNGIVLNNGQNITAIMISDGNIVALRIGNLSQLENLYDRIYNQNQSNLFLRAYNSRVIEPIDEECFDGTIQLCSDPILEEKYKNNLDNFLNDANLGIDLYKATKDSDGNYVWNCID